MPKPLDFTQPLEVHDRGGGTGRLARVTAKYPNGSFRAFIGSNDMGGLLFDENGDYLGCDEGGSRGSALCIRNPEVKPVRFSLEMSAEELAYVRILLGATTGNTGYNLFKDIDDVANPENGLCSEVVTHIRMNLGDEFERIVEAYEKAGKTDDGSIFQVTRRKD